MTRGLVWGRHCRYAALWAPGALELTFPGLWPGILNLCDFLLVAPDTINNHVKTCREEQKNLHFFAPEYGGTVQLLCWPC